MSGQEQKGATKRLLVADDEPSLRRFVQAVLEMQGHEVVAVEDGQKALDAARGSHFDGIVLDINMPFMTGIEVLQRLRMEPETRDTFVVLLTSMASEDDVNEGLWHGANLYLTKPVSPQVLAGVFAN